MKVLRKEPGKAPEPIEVDSDFLTDLRDSGTLGQLDIASDCCLLSMSGAELSNERYNCTVFGRRLFGTVYAAGRMRDKLTDISDTAVRVLRAVL